jgi:hypothetical protein
MFRQDQKVKRETDKVYKAPWAHLGFRFCLVND